MKKIITALLAALMLTSISAAAADKTDRAVLACYDENGKLVYSKLLTPENSEIPEQYKDMTMKVYLPYTGEIISGSEYLSGAPAATPEPAKTPAPAATPAATSAPTKAPVKTPAPADGAAPKTPYKKAVDGIYAPAIVTGNVLTVSEDGEEYFEFPVYYQGREEKVLVEKDLQISSAPEMHANLQGSSAQSLKKGDVITMLANVSGTRIKTLGLVMRPPADDIVTSDIDYGADFEKLFTAGGGKYTYKLGVIADVRKNLLTLLTKSQDFADAAEIDVNPNAYVYSCDVSGREYEIENGTAGDIFTSLPQSVLRDDVIVLDDTYMYNYALVRMVDGEAVDIVAFNNYNDN